MKTKLILLLALSCLSFGCRGPQEIVSPKSEQIGKIRKLDMSALKTFVEQPHSFKRKPNIYFVFVDTLRSDHVNETDTPNIYDITKDSLHFEKSYSSSTVTHSSTYGIFYANPVIYRDRILLNNWDKGSPFLQGLKRGGYKVYMNGSPWQFCINTDKAFNTKEQLMNSAESNLQLTYGFKTKDLVDFCYPNPGGVSIPQKEPKVKYNGIDEDGKEIAHQGYRDHAVVSDLLKMIDSRPATETGNMHIIYFSSVHDPYAWLEHGVPRDDGSDQLDPVENYYKIDKPYFPWNANWDSYRPKNPTDEFRTQIKNSYKNAIRGVDYQIARLTKKLKERGEYDNSLIVVVSDHGEFLHEDKLFPANNVDRLGHCCAIYNETTNVPISIKFPNGEFAERRKIGSHLDIFPTIYDYLGYSNQTEIPKIAVGKSLFSSTRSCAMSFDPRGDIAPNNFYVVNANKNKLHFSVVWQPSLNAEQIKARYLVDEFGQPIADYREGGEKDAYRILRQGSYTQCLEEIVDVPFNDPNRCPTISATNITELDRSFELYNNLDELQAPFVQEKPVAALAAQEKSGAKVLEDFNEVPLIESKLDNLLKQEFLFDTAFFQNELKKASNYQTLVDKNYFDKLNKLKRATGYTFIGAGTSPQEVEANNGFCALKGNFDLNQYYHEGETAQFISTSRSPLVAKRFASVKFSDKSPRNGWVYVVLNLGGIQDPHIDEKLKHKDIKSIPTTEKNKNVDDNYDLPILMSLYAEQEVATPRGINWNQVIAYRAVKSDGLFSGPIYVRSTLSKIDKDAYDKIINKLSGE